MCFSNYLEMKKPSHLILLEYIKVYETIKDKESELDYLTIQKAEAEAQINSVRASEYSDEMH